MSLLIDQSAHPPRLFLSPRPDWFGLFKVSVNTARRRWPADGGEDHRRRRRPSALRSVGPVPAVAPTRGSLRRHGEGRPAEEEARPQRPAGGERGGEGQLLPP